MKIHLAALGCRLNEAELETWARQFQERGHPLAPRAEQADILVVNTCAVTDEAVRKSRKLLRRLHRLNPSARLVVSGCYASLEAEATARLAGIDLVVANRDKSRLVELISERLALPLMPRLAMETDGHPMFARGRQRAFIKVQEGCRYRCTFCIVTLARGEERSRPIAEIIAEINQLHQQGIQEVVLAGVHLGGYGRDHGVDLGDLLRAVLADCAVPRIRLGSLEPWDLPRDFWPLFQSPRLMPHLHLPLQSGSDTVLRRMARRCTADAFRSLVAEARAQVADFNLSSDIIVGFPGENDLEWQQTLDLVEEIGFGHLHLFAFSPRAGTKAATLPDPVPEAITRQRGQELECLARRLKGENLRRYLGRTLPVLFEGDQPDADGIWSGYSPNYLRVAVPATGAGRLTNRILPVSLEEVEGEIRLLGRLDPGTGAEACSSGKAAPPEPAVPDSAARRTD